MIGIEKGRMTTMINEVNTMTPRQNDLVVKNRQIDLGTHLYQHPNSVISRNIRRVKTSS